MSEQVSDIFAAPEAGRLRPRPMRNAETGRARGDAPRRAADDFGAGYRRATRPSADRVKPTSLEKDLSAQQEEGARRAPLATRSRRRMYLVAFVFAIVMCGAAFKLADLAALSSASEPNRASRVAEPAAEIAASRRKIVDRNGRALAGQARMYDLYFDTRLLSYPEEGAEVVATLTNAFPQLNKSALTQRFAAGGAPTVMRAMTPRQAQRAHDLGWPGLHFGTRDIRVHHAGRATAHVVGWVNGKGVGQAGVEGAMQATLAAGGAPVALSIDLRAQLAAREAVAEAMIRTRAKAGSAIVLSPETGEVLAMVSLPDFDPHNMPAPPKPGEPGERHPQFNHAVQGLYEYGSVMKVITWALALNTNTARMSDVFDPPQPFMVDGHTIRDGYRYGELSFPMALAKSSNIIAARLALKVGRAAQQRFFERLGLNEPTGIELFAAAGIEPKWPAPWGASTTAAAAYGHGGQVSLLHVAAAAATLINGGERVRPTILRHEGPRPEGERVVSPEVSKRVRELLRLAVTNGTGRRAAVEGLEIGGKTGTAIKPDGRGGYHQDRVVSSFVAAFPMSAPKVVVAVMLDEPEVEINGEKKRGASYTAAPLARDVIERISAFIAPEATILASR